MKKTKLVLGVLLVALLVVGCGKKDKKTDNPDKPNNNAVAGDKLDIKLDANPSTAYEWTYEVTGDDVIVLESRFEEDKDCEGLDGCGGKEIYTVSSVAAGEVKIKFVYARPDSGDPYNLVAEYDITINDDLIISEKHSGTYFEK